MMVMRTCSFMVNGPGFSENENPVRGTFIGLLGSVAAMSFPIGSTAIWAETVERLSALFRNPKNWFTNDRMTHEASPRTHVLKVNAA